MPPVVELAGAGWVVAAIVMALLWAWHVRLKNAAVVDAGWAGLVGALAIFYAINAHGMAGRRMAIASMMGSWGARLAVHLLYDRVFARTEDGRYAALRHARGDRANTWFFWFFQARALAAVFFSLPALLSVVNEEAAFAPGEYVAAGLWAVAFSGETTADRQLLEFKADPGNRGKAYQGGLWRYSRHPNYFFEWLMWVAYAMFAAGSSETGVGWIAFACPAAMLYLLFMVTGIPAAEAQALRSRGHEYRVYQKTTSPFVPWFPRRGSNGVT